MPTTILINCLVTLSTICSILLLVPVLTLETSNVSGLISKTTCLSLIEYLSDSLFLPHLHFFYFLALLLCLLTCPLISC